MGEYPNEAMVFAVQREHSAPSYMVSPERVWVKQKTPGMAPRVFLKVKGLVYFTICKREVAEVSSVMMFTM